MSTANVKTVRIKPNPAGKDRTKNGTASAAQLGGEWVDVQNVCSTSVKMDGVTLYHIAYTGPRKDKPEWEKVMTFNGTLKPAEVIRVHSGSGPESALKTENRTGATYHFFTRNNYVWNNDKADRSALWLTGQNQPFDQPWYEANPPEGKVLQRVGDKLIALANSAAG